MTTVTQSEFARQQGWVKSYVTKLKGEGRLVMTDDGLVDVEASLARIQGSTQRPEQASPPAVGKTLTELQAEEKSLDIQRKRREELEAVGQLLDANEVAGALADAAVTLRATFEAWPERHASPLAALGGDEARIAAYLHDQVEAAFAELSRRFAALAGQAAD